MFGIVRVGKIGFVNKLFLYYVYIDRGFGYVFLNLISMWLNMYVCMCIII